MNTTRATSTEFKRSDYSRRVSFCQTMLEKHREDTHFSTAFCGATSRPVKEMDILICIISTVGSWKIPMK
nr:unnamed protein product [Callosobruchus chinensis]